MEPLTLKDLSGNAFRVLGLTASATQADIDSAARKMRIWQDPAKIPATANDARWIGVVSRTPKDIESAVARLSDPISRLNQRLWWFCDVPPKTDLPPVSDPSEICAFHDVALLHLYRGLLRDAVHENLPQWKAIIERFGRLAASKDYLQWLCDVESAGDFEKRAGVDEITRAQNQITQRLATAVSKSVDQALAADDVAAAAQAVQLVRSIGTDSAGDDPAEPLLDRIEDDLASRCGELTDRIDIAWKTRHVQTMRKACNGVVADYGKVIWRQIYQLAAATEDVDRRSRARMHGVRLLMHASKAYEASYDYIASERTLQTALPMATDTPLEPTLIDLLEKVKPGIQKQRAKTLPNQRRGGLKASGGSRLTTRWIWVSVGIVGGVMRACVNNHNEAPYNYSPTRQFPSRDNSPPPDLPGDKLDLNTGS